MKTVSAFAKALLHWHTESNDRSLPWKEEKDPYKIWLSEIILQQTRAEQGLPYYLRFIAQYPTITDLAKAPEDEVFRLWQGLGYYARCRNLLHTAREIAERYNGRFPDQYDDIIALKGVGAYTAAAIASFAYGLPYPVIDGNVYRVLSRYFSEPTPVNTPEGKKIFTELADAVFDAKHPAAYNQAIMDFGAVVCKPKQPLCAECCLSAQCKAYNNGTVAELPVKLQKIKVKERWLNYWVLVCADKVYVQQRTARDVWQSLYEFFLAEDRMPEHLHRLLNDTQYVSSKQEQVLQTKQRLTHQLIHSTFSVVHLNAIPDYFTADGSWVSYTELDNYSFPKTIVSFLEEKPYFYLLN